MSGLASEHAAGPDTAVPPGQHADWLEAAHRLLHDGGGMSPGAWLQALAQTFHAAGAGLANVQGERVEVACRLPVSGRLALPWEHAPELLAQLRNSPAGLAVQDNDGNSWLLSAIPSSCQAGILVWLEAEAMRDWTEAEKAVLSLAARGRVRAEDAGAATNGRLTRQGLARANFHLETASAITARLAHDFSNILTGILGFAELSLSQVARDSTLQLYLREVWDSAKRGTQWLQKLQLFSRRRPGEFHPTALPALLAEEQPRLRQAWGASVALHLVVPPDLPPVAVERESLRELLLQLLNNAREAVAGTGVVTLAVRPRELSDQDCQEVLGECAPGPHLEVTIQDTGSGISEQTRQRIFQELFFSSKPRHRGLGLPVVYGILRTFKGGLSFASQPLQGAAVRVFLPLAGDRTRPASAGGQVAPAGRSRVLVVDDDPLILSYVASTLERAGFTVQVAAGASEALHLYTAPGLFGLVITDVLMPQIDGFELARRLRHVDAGVKMLFISAYHQGPAQREKTPGQSFPVLAKPFRPEALLQAVGTALGTAPATFPVPGCP
jgi:signal transduction histidine kinase